MEALVRRICCLLIATLALAAQGAPKPQFTTVVIDGGLDLVTAPQAVQPGRLTACSNYEVARQRGIRRMDGYEKYDGGQSPSTGNGILAYATLQTDNPPFGMTIGDTMYFITMIADNQYGTVVYIDSTGAYPVVYVSLIQPLPYDLSAQVGRPGFAFEDVTNPGTYNILAAGSGAPGATIYPPQNLVLQAVTRSGGILENNSTYAYRVTANNTNGSTTPSDEVTVTTNLGTETTTTGSPTSLSIGIRIPVFSHAAYTAGHWIRIVSGTNSVSGQIKSFLGGAIIIDSSTATITGALAAMPLGLTVNWQIAVIAVWDPVTVPSGIPAVTTYGFYGRTSPEKLIANVNIGDGLTIPYYTDLGTVTPNGQQPITNTTGTVESWLDNLADNFNVISATVQQVPGQGNVNGIFWLRDQVYATRDYLSINYNGGSEQPNIGDTIFQGSDFGSATWTAQVAKLTINTGSFAESNDAAGVLMVYNENGYYAAGALVNHTQSDVTFATGGTSGASNATSSAAGLYVADGGRGVTAATRSWQWCDLGWTVGYKSGEQPLVDMNFALAVLANNQPQYQTTEWKVPNSASVSGTSWNNGGGFVVANIQVPGDNLYDGWTFWVGTSKPQSTLVNLSSFGFTNADIPATASVTGIEVQMRYGAIGYTTHYTSSPIEKTIQLVGVTNGPTPNLASSTPYTVVGIVGSGTIPAASYASYSWLTKMWGAPTTVADTPTDLLGYTGVTPADLVDAGFGMQMAWALSGAQTNQEIQIGIDYLAIRVSFLPQTNLIYFWNVGATSPSAVKAQIVMHYRQGGDITVGTETGQLYFQFVQSDGSVGGIPSRAIGADEQIRTYPANGTSPDGGMADGSTLLALSATSADMNSMDWSALLTGAPQPDGSTSPPSKYQSVTKNFYASAGLEAIYGVSGGGPAFYYDGVKTDASGNTVAGNFSRILTGLPLRFETPREIAAHQSHIILGYYSGVIQWSNAANTLSFDPTLYDETAGDDGFGDRVVGVRSINGDTLCVWTQSTIQMMQGNFNIPAGNQVTPSLYTSTLSPTSGGIEYTIQPMANYMYCDFRGITAIGATQKYGDFELGHYSSIISPWIIPRVQLSSFFEGPNIGIINSVLIRNKNMARFFFADGAALSMTFLEDNEPPQFTIQNYCANDGATPLTWDVVQAFTETLGRDRIFGATADGTGWVYELERANSFNGADIVATATLVPDVAQTPYLRKEFRGINVFGQAQDYATFHLSRSNDYNQPQQASGSNVITATFGSLAASPTGTVAPAVSFPTANLSIEGSAINLRVDSQSDRQFPHLIQAISYTIKPLDERKG